MKAINSTHLLIGLAMLAVAGLTLTLTPRLKLADQRPMVSLDAMIPKQFGEWKLDETIVPSMVTPEVQAQLNRIYNQILTRNYINGKGERIMLSIAYGSDQRYAMRVHQPEGCYAGQGFQLGSTSRDVIEAGGVQLPVMKLVATRGQRIEPITYWITIGDTAVRVGLERNLVEWKYGLSGKIPYGVIIRVSAISADESQAYRTQEEFVRDLLKAMPIQARKLLVGAG